MMVETTSLITLGFEIKAVGSSVRAAEYAGIRVGRTRVLAMMLSGGFAGLAGVTDSPSIIMVKGSTYMSSASGVQPEIASAITGVILLFSACALDGQICNPASLTVNSADCHNKQWQCKR